jgi:hypothetical protein
VADRHKCKKSKAFLPPAFCSFPIPNVPHPRQAQVQKVRPLLLLGAQEEDAPRVRPRRTAHAARPTSRRARRLSARQCPEGVGRRPRCPFLTKTKGGWSQGSGSNGLSERSDEVCLPRHSPPVCGSAHVRQPPRVAALAMLPGP